MMFAAGAYSGPWAVCGPVAQPTKNATHVAAAVSRSWIDIFGGLEFIGFGHVDADRFKRFLMTPSARV
jgi:hypothetical protein